jgi:TATA-binding protein-associated factor
MGLGKTLQTIAVLASHHHSKGGKCTSLVVCPSTLTGHWYHEIHRYCDNLSPLCYVGTSAERKKILPSVSSHSVIITSYEVLRNDVEVFTSYAFEYCVLDEGHVIRNAKTKTTKAVKLMKARFRLLLSGTPIQNNVLELWSMFDFLMPGFLGTESQFNERFAKPILASRDAKKSSSAQENGSKALKALHRQVLPFLLRRLKEEVLHDLPPKIIQDYYCDMSPLQEKLYKSVVEETDVDKKTHVFQSLQSLRKICNHPILYLRGTRSLQAEDAKLHDIENAPKLLSLRQLLWDCGIGGHDTSPSDISSTEISQHRVLIFCQMKLMLDLIEKDLFQIHMPSVSYLRLDGSTDPKRRHAIVQKFNDDPSIDVLLLTTSTGGLGLNLTGADTVVFVEHDWNPMKDLQAMDRAHRLGQRRVVNVYRLIARNSLEEKIMGLQRFKLHIAGQVVNQQNSSMDSMDTDQVLDLFTSNETDSQSKKRSKQQGSKSLGGGGSVTTMEALDELCQQQYDDEYNVEEFLASM